MTGQIADTVIYKDEDYRIVGEKGYGLTSPYDFGIKPTMMSTACYRGYFALYTVKDDQLMLTGMTVQTIDNLYPPIEGVEAVVGGMFGAGQYIDLAVPTKYTGGLLLARNFIQSMYVHMGFQKPTSFETVIELLVEKGRVTQAIDHSAKMAQMRADLQKPMPKAGFDDPTIQREQVSDWISWTFSLDYDL